MSSPAFVYLASQSPRRRELLAQIGVRYELLLPAPDEDVEALEAERQGELPAHYVERVARAKLRAAKARLKARTEASMEASVKASVNSRESATLSPILCSDTTVALGRRILGKPRDAADARATLALLSGRTHRVITAVAVAGSRSQHFALSVSRVHLAPLSARAIEAYVASGEPFGKAGAYAIQGRMAAWVTRIEGSYSGIMGLPLFETATILRRCGMMLTSEAAT